MIHYSFKEFFIVIGVLTVIYLAFVLLRYYRKETMALFSRSGYPNPREEEEETFGPFENFNAEQVTDQSQSEDFHRAEVIIPKIKEIIIYAGINNHDQRQIYQALNTIISEYPAVEDPVMREGITELIIHECEKHGAVKPEKRELDELWENASA
jgi:hypothetical protein